MLVSILAVLLILVMILLAVIRQKDFVIENVPKLTVTSPAFKANGTIPVDYTGNGKNSSPELHLSELDERAVSLAIIMDDIDHPLAGVYNHWLIWNLPIMDTIPAEIP
jgi:hypothetical protein